MFKIRIPLNGFSQFDYKALSAAFDTITDDVLTKTIADPKYNDFAKNNYILRKYNKNNDIKGIDGYDFRIEGIDNDDGVRIGKIDGGIVIGNQLFTTSLLNSTPNEDISMLHNISNEDIKNNWNENMLLFRDNDSLYGGVFIANKLKVDGIEETNIDGSKVLCTNDGIVLVLTEDMLILVDILYENAKDKTDLDNINDLSQSIQDPTRYKPSENYIHRKLLSTPRLTAITNPDELAVLRSIKQNVTKKGQSTEYTIIPIDPGFVFKRKTGNGNIKLYFSNDWDSLCFYIASPKPKVNLQSTNEADEPAENTAAEPRYDDGDYNGDYNISEQWTNLELTDGTVYHVLEIDADKYDGINKILTQVAYAVKVETNERRALWMTKKFRKHSGGFDEGNMLLDLSFSRKDENTDGYVFSMPQPTKNVYEMMFETADVGTSVPQVINLTSNRVNSFDKENAPANNEAPHYNYTKGSNRTVSAIMKLKVDGSIPTDSIHIEIY